MKKEKKFLITAGFWLFAVSILACPAALPPPSSGGAASAPGYGMLVLNVAGTAERSILPNGMNALDYEANCTASGETPVTETLAGGYGSITLKAELSWTITVQAKNSGTVVGSIIIENVSLADGETKQYNDLFLKPAAGTGTLVWSVAFPNDGSVTDAKLYYDNGTAQTENLLSKNNDSLTLNAGSYLFRTVLIAGNGRQAGKTEVVHIYNGMTSTLNWEFSASDFIAAMDVPVNVSFSLSPDVFIEGVTLYSDLGNAEGISTYTGFSFILEEVSLETLQADNLYLEIETANNTLFTAVNNYPIEEGDSLITLPSINIYTLKLEAASNGSLQAAVAGNASILASANQADLFGGEAVTITAVPASNHSFSAFSAQGISPGAAAPWTFTMPGGNVSVAAAFVYSGPVPTLRTPNPGTAFDLTLTVFNSTQETNLGLPQGTKTITIADYVNLNSSPNVTYTAVAGNANAMVNTAAPTTSFTVTGRIVGACTVTLGILMNDVQVFTVPIVFTVKTTDFPGAFYIASNWVKMTDDGGSNVSQGGDTIMFDENNHSYNLGAAPAANALTVYSFMLKPRVYNFDNPIWTIRFSSTANTNEGQTHYEIHDGWNNMYLGAHYSGTKKEWAAQASSMENYAYNNTIFNRFDIVINRTGSNPVIKIFLNDIQLKFAQSSTTGDRITGWTFDANGTLTASGTGSLTFGQYFAVKTWSNTAGLYNLTLMPVFGEPPALGTMNVPVSVTITPNDVAVSSVRLITADNPAGVLGTPSGNNYNFTLTGVDSSASSVAGMYLELTTAGNILRTVAATQTISGGSITLPAQTIRRLDLSANTGGTITAAVAGANITVTDPGAERLGLFGGESVTVTANLIGSGTFNGFTATGITPSSYSSSPWTFTMPAGNAAVTASFTATTAPAGYIGSNDALKVVSGYLRNKSNDEVVLRGTNLGGWMLQETWLCPVMNSNGQTSDSANEAWAFTNTINALNGRFSSTVVRDLLDSYMDNWIRIEDFQWMKAKGMNCLRIPFWYRNFMADTNGTWIGDNGSSAATNNPGFQRLDWAITQAKKRGIYVILDLHGAVGGQSTNHSSGTLSQNSLYTNTAHENATVALWQAIAQRYKDEAAVAAYDLLNEPQNNHGSSGNTWAPDSARGNYETIRMYDLLYRKVREVDPDKIIIMEAVWHMARLPNPSLIGRHGGSGSDANNKLAVWQNVMYSMHLYDGAYSGTSQSGFNSQITDMKNARTNWGVALHVGEFNNGDSWQDYAYDQYNTNKINWNTWTYKLAGANRGNWSLHQNQNATNINPQSTSQTNIQTAWGTTLRTFTEGSNPGANSSPASGWSRQSGKEGWYTTGQNHTISGVFTNSNQSGWPKGGVMGPINAADNNTGSGLWY